MRTWEGGRGNEFLSDDPTRYFDGYGWTLTPGVWHQAPQWWQGEFSGPTTAATTTPATTVDSQFSADNFLPGSMRSSAGYNMLWRSMASTTHLARSFLQQGSSYIMSRTQMWVRKIGTPRAPLNLRILSSATTAGGAGRPASSALAGTTAQLNSTSVEELESFIWNAAMTTASTQTGTTTPNWWVEVWTSLAGTDVNHWEIGYNSSAGVASTVMQGAGTSGGWTAASTVNFYFRVAPAQVDRKWHIFGMDRATYAIEEKADGSTGTRLFINGDRGLVSTATANTTSLLVDATKSWQTNRWVGATVYIVRATVGAGQFGDITANGSTSLTVSLGVAPSTDAEYVIYNTNEWSQISSAIADSSLGDNPVRDVAVAGNMAYMAFGGTTAIGYLQWATSVHQSDKSTAIAESSLADSLHYFTDPVAGPQLWRTLSSLSQVSRATTQGFTTHVTFSSGITIGSTEYRITNILDYNDEIYAFKEDSLWRIKNDRASKLSLGIDAFPSSNNGKGAAAQNLFLFFGWSHSLERLYSGTLDDIGPWKGAGMKVGHQGPFSVVLPYIAWTLGGIDAGSTGRSAALAWNGRGWHEFYRAPTSGYRIQNMYMQNNPGANPRLWMSVGGELICQRWPKDTLNPRNDRGVFYQHEAVLETGTIDMNAVQMPKLFGKTHAVTRNLASTQAQIYAEYQLDDDIGTTSWLPIGRFSQSPIDSLNIRRGDKHAIRMRYRGLTQNSTVASELHAAVVKAVGRTPNRRQWSIRALTGDFQVDAAGLEDADPDQFYMWMQDLAATAEPVLMHSVWESMDNIYVYVEHPILNRVYTTPDGSWGGNLTLTIREIDD